MSPSKAARLLPLTTVQILYTSEVHIQAYTESLNTGGFVCYGVSKLLDAVDMMHPRVYPTDLGIYPTDKASAEAKNMLTKNTLQGAH